MKMSRRGFLGGVLGGLAGTMGFGKLGKREPKSKCPKGYSTDHFLVDKFCLCWRGEHKDVIKILGFKVEGCGVRAAYEVMTGRDRGVRFTGTTDIFHPVEWFDTVAEAVAWEQGKLARVELPYPIVQSVCQKA